MSIRPWDKFYYSDWRADPALGMCSLAARGLWLEMLALMHEADPRGHLLINGNPPDETQLAALARCPSDQVPVLLAELEKAGVFNRRRDRVIYSRRQVRDEKRRKDGEKAAKNGTIPGSRRDRQAAGKQQETEPAPPVVDGVEDQTPPHPEARDQKLEKKVTPFKSPRGDKPSRGTKLPDGFPDLHAKQLAEAYWFQHGREDIDFDDQAKRFRAHHLAKGTSSKDWGQSWVTWYSNSPQFTRAPPAQPKGERSALMTEILRRANEPAH